MDEAYTVAILTAQIWQLETENAELRQQLEEERLERNREVSDG